MHNFTPEDLICYLYKETSQETAVAIEAAICEDWTLKEKLAVVKASQERLNGLIESPRTEIVLNVLRYAAQKDAVAS